MSIYDQIANAGNSWQFGTAAMKIRQASDNRKLAAEEMELRKAQFDQQKSEATRKAELDRAKEGRAIKEAERAAIEFERAGATREADVLAEAGANAWKIYGANKDLTEATVAFGDALRSSGVTDDEIRELQAAYDPDGDGTLNEEHMGRLKAFAEVRGKLKEEPSFAPNELTKLQDRLADPNTRPEDIPDIKARIAKLTAITGTTPDDPQPYNKRPTARDKNVLEFEETTIGAVSAVQTGTELLKISRADPSALGKPGAIAKFGNDMLVTAAAIGKMAGIKNIDIDRDIGNFNFDKFDSGPLKQAAIESTAFRAGVYGIAFAAAVAEQGTRPTDKDIQQFIDQIGGNSSDPAAFRRTIVQFMARQDRRLHTIADVKQIPAAVQDAAFGAWDRAYAEFQYEAELQPGFEKNGYRYKGGDPSVKSNWEKI